MPITLRFEHFMKVLSPMLVIPEGNTIDPRELHSSNTPSSIVVTESGILTETREEQNAKVCPSIVFTLLGISIHFNELHL